MGAGHRLTGLERAPRASERTSIILACFVGGILFLTLFGAALTWPTDTDFRGAISPVLDGGQFVTATVVDQRADGSFDVTVLGQETAGTQTMQPVLDPALVVEVGDKIRALTIPDDNSVVFVDHERSSPMLVLFIMYVVLVIAVAWWRGLGALLGLAAAFGVVLFYAVPALFSGHQPLVVGLVTGAGALFVLLYIAHGPNARTTTAYLGTLAGLIITTALAWWAVNSSHLSGAWSAERGYLELWYWEVPLSGLVLCGIILAGLGVLNDVTVAQSSAVWELRAARPDMSRWELFARGMRIGRDHIASTVYTIAFVYVGAALPSIMLVSMYDSTPGMVLTTGEIAEEVVRTLVSSIGLVLAVPMTTAIAAAVVGEQAVREEDQAFVSLPGDDAGRAGTDQGEDSDG